MFYTVEHKMSNFLQLPYKRNTRSNTSLGTEEMLFKQTGNAEINITQADQGTKSGTQ